MNAAFTLTHPALLWGLLAAGLPVLIHLLLRARPRRVRFPALALMRAALVSGQRANRLRNVLLMLLRAAVLACAALLLTGPTCAPSIGEPRGGGPIACVIILDDSLSTRYRPRFDDSATLLDEIGRQALAALEASAGWPAGSELAVLRAGGPNASAALTSNRGLLARDLQDAAGDTPHARPLGPAIQDAARLLRSAPQAVRRIVVATDMTASAWRGVSPATLAGIDRLAVRVVGPVGEARTNLALLAVSPPATVCPASAPTAVRVMLKTTGIGSDCWLTVRSGEQVLTRVGPVKLAPDTTHEVTLRAPPLPAGPHAAVVTLEPDDLLTFDQERYVAWQTGPQPEAWLLAARDAGPARNLSALIFRNLLAPEMLPPDQQRVAIHVVQPEEVAALLADSASSEASERRLPTLVIAFTGVELPPAAREALVRTIERGATLLLVPSSGAAVADWPGLRALLSEASPVVDALASPTTIRWDAPPAATAGEDELAELSRCVVQRRVRLSGLLADVRSVASYADGVPAIISRRLGRGRVLALTTSPDPQWSDLGVRAAGLLTWLHRTLDEALGPPTAVAQFTAGQSPLDVFDVLPAAALVHVSVQGRVRREPTWVRLSRGVPQQPWPTDVAGIYTARSGGADESTALYAVNWPAEESDLTPITRDGIVRALGMEQVTLETGGAAVAVAAGWGWLHRLRDPAQTLGLLLLVLFVLEMAAAARRPSPSTGYGHPAADGREPVPRAP